MVTKPNIVRISIPETSFKRGRSFPLSQISEHHIVGDAQAAINKARTKEFSCTFTIAMDGTIFQLVDIKDTPYTDNDYRSNGRSITIEHAGGGQFPYTEAMYRSSIHLHAWLFQEHGELNCVRHRDIPEIKADPSKATACCGTLDIDRIKREAKLLLKGEDIVKPTVEDVKWMFANWIFEAPSNDQIQYYIARDIRDLYKDILFYGVRPKEAEIRKAFSELQPWQPIDTPPHTDQSKHYQGFPNGVLYKDLAYGLKKRVIELMENDQKKAEKLKELQMQSDSDKEAGDSFLRRVGQFIKRYLP